MEYNYYSYEKPEVKIEIQKLPKWFKEVKFEGDEKEGHITFNSHNDYDEIYGSNAKMEISWEKKFKNGLYFGKEVQHSIELYNAVDFAITKRENTWLLSHEFVSWFGQRTKMMRKRFYRENCIHGIFYCDITERLFNIHVNVIDKYYENFKPFIVKSFMTFLCHE